MGSSPFEIKIGGFWRKVKRVCVMLWGGSKSTLINGGFEENEMNHWDFLACLIEE
ncbi:hypothetical protein Hanom_Chr10g00948811 [Helianthus anomalus]